MHQFEEEDQRNVKSVKHFHNFPSAMKSQIIKYCNEETQDYVDRGRLTLLAMGQCHGPTTLGADSH